MIGSLRGTVIDISPRKDAKDNAVDVLIESHGVGYRAIISASTLAHLGGLGATAFLHIHTHVREDALTLYGFGSREERMCFEALIGAHGVGPSVALAILATHSPNALIRILNNDDVNALCDVPGIGKKTAAKLLIELKSRLDLPLLDLSSSVLGGDQETGMTDGRREVRAALSGLGYAGDEIREAMLNIPDASPEEQLRDALRRLAVSR